MHLESCRLLRAEESRRPRRRAGRSGDQAADGGVRAGEAGSGGGESVGDDQGGGGVRRRSMECGGKAKRDTALVLARGLSAGAGAR